MSGWPQTLAADGSLNALSPLAAGCHHTSIYIHVQIQQCVNALQCLQEEFVLQHMAEVFTCLRSCNVALRWLFLHTCSSHKKLRAAVASSAPPMQDLLALLLDTALLEFEV